MDDNNVYSFGSHTIALVASLYATEGDVLEFGMGPVSTPLIHSLLHFTGRTIVSVEEDKGWVEASREYECKWHKVCHAGILLKKAEILAPQGWSVVFIDSGALAEDGDPERFYRDRRALARMFKDKAEIMVIHDTERPTFRCNVQWQAFEGEFKYCWICKTPRAWTTVLSNGIDVRDWLRRMIA